MPRLSSIRPQNPWSRILTEREKSDTRQNQQRGPVLTFIVSVVQACSVSVEDTQKLMREQRRHDHFEAARVDSRRPGTDEVKDDMRCKAVRLKGLAK